jgi:hypothetical protein
VLPTCGSLDAVHVGHRALTGTYVPARNLEGAMTTLSFARPHRLAPWLWLCIATLITLALGAAWLPGQSWAAVSAQSWSPAVVLTPDGNASNGVNGSLRPQYLVGTGADGTAVAVWERVRSDDKVIELSHRAPGGDWSEPVTLAVVGQHYWLSDLVVDAAGRATYSVYFIGHVVRYSGFVQTWHPNGQLSSKLHTVSKDGCTFSSDCGTDLVGDAQGDVMAVWGSGATGRVSYRASGGSWTAPSHTGSPVAGYRMVGRPQLSMNAAGKVYWVGAYYDRAHAPQQVDQIGLRTWRPETGRWSDLSRVAYVDNDVEDLSTATNDRGDLVVGWTDVYDDGETASDTTVKSTFVAAGSLPPGYQKWRKGKIWADDQASSMNGVGIDTHGNATVVWSTAQPDFTSVAINTARRELDDGVWGAGSVVATTTAHVHDTQVMVNGHGTTMLTSREYGVGPASQIVTRLRPPNGSYGTAQYLTPEGQMLDPGLSWSLAPNSDAALLYAVADETPVYALTFG